MIIKYIYIYMHTSYVTNVLRSHDKDYYNIYMRVCPNGHGQHARVLTKDKID